MNVGELVTLLEAYAEPDDDVVFSGGGGTYTNVALSHNERQPPLGALTIAQRDAIGVCDSAVSLLRDGSPGPVRLADRSKARDGLLCWTPDVGKGCPAFVRCESSPEDREAQS